MRPSAKLYQRGFSVLELVLVVALILSVAAVCVPNIEVASAVSDQEVAADACRAIARGLRDFESDAGFPATGVRGQKTFSWLRSPGADPEFQEHPRGEVGDLRWFLGEDRMGAGHNWCGPYVDRLESDPWGRRYVVLMGDTQSSHLNVWVLSAGVDGIINTTVNDREIQGDDLGALVRRHSGPSLVSSK